MRKATRRRLGTAAACLFAPLYLYCQDTGAPVSREQYENLLREHEQLKKEMQEMRAFKEQVSKKLQQDQPVQNFQAQAAHTTSPPAPADANSYDSDAPLRSWKESLKQALPGSDKFVITGYGSAGLQLRQADDKAFSAQFNPIFLWKPADRLLFEGELELELENTETSVALETAQLSYVLNDYMTLGAGKFLNPMDAFTEKFHMHWVNRLPDAPLAVYDGLLPETFVGAQIRGGIPLGSTKLAYALFAANAPALKTSVDDPADLSELGTLEFDDFSNMNNHIAYGGHVGFFPISTLELGYGAEYSQVGPGHSANALLQSADISYVNSFDAIRGMIRIYGQWTWSDVSRFTYDPTGALGFGPVTFPNRRSGGYGQISYRPTMAENGFLKNLEGAVRYDRLDQSDTPAGFNEERYTVGLNYWLTPMTVFKVGLQLDNKDHSFKDQNALLFQFATGF